LHIRGNPDAQNPENDNGSCYLILFLGKNEYNTEINMNYNVQIPSTYFDVSEAANSYLNTLYRKVHFTTMSGASLTLEEVSNPATKGLPYYNLWGERNCIAFLIGNQGGTIADTSYNALSFANITIERGAEFPAYQTTNGEGTSDVRYTQVDTVKMNIMGAANWYWLTSSTASFDFAYGDTQIDGLSASKETVSTDQGSEEKTFIHLHTTTNNYAGLSSQALVEPASDLTRYVYVNGRSLFYRPSEGTLAYVNLNGRENTLSLSVDDLTVDEITEIIVQKGCALPAATSSSVAREIYGSMAYYTVLRSVSYDGNNGTFTPSESLVWTVYFDSGFPVRVANSKYLDIDAIRPQAREKQTFKTWVDANGEQISGNIQIDSGKEFFSQWTTLCDVTLVNDGQTQVKRLQQYQRLTSFDDIYSSLYPTKDGYRFLGWYQDDGTRFPIDNKIVTDMTLTASWEAIPGYQPSSSLSTTDIVWISILSASTAGIIIFGVLFFAKRKKKPINKD
jgi:uncharacterized repeat protein (TIGR02543 family)